MFARTVSRSCRWGLGCMHTLLTLLTLASLSRSRGPNRLHSTFHATAAMPCGPAWSHSDSWLSAVCGLEPLSVCMEPSSPAPGTVHGRSPRADASECCAVSALWRRFLPGELGALDVMGAGCSGGE